MGRIRIHKCRIRIRESGSEKTKKKSLDPEHWETHLANSSIYLKHSRHIENGHFEESQSDSGQK
jgi:hypothetical protein